MKVLHITEAYGGGVTSAINSYVVNSLQYDHYLFAVPRVDDLTGDEKNGAFKNVYISKRTYVFILDLKKIIKEIEPDILHIHSTYAGVACRLLPFINKNKSIYTPHGYSFLRHAPFYFTKTYHFIERILAKRTRLIAGCGREERNIAAMLIGDDRAVELINVCDPLPDLPAIHSLTKLPVIGMVGRISKQKGFEFFNQVARLLSHRAHFKWIGGGDDDCESLLRNNGVEVTGWITRNEVVAHLKGLDLYFHSAAWEGFPISVLETGQLGIPMVLRDIGPFTAEGLPVVENVGKTVQLIEKWLDEDQYTREMCHATTTQINEYHSVTRLKKALSDLYGSF